MQVPASPQVWTPPASPSGYSATTATAAAPAPVYAGSPAPAFPAPGVAMEAPVFFRYANFGQRLVALILDSLIVGALEAATVAVMYTLVIGLGYLAGDVGGALVFTLLAWVMTPALCLAVAVIYFLKGETGLDQGTIGKRVMGIKVVTLQGGTISGGQSVGRLFSRFFSSLFFCLGYFLALFTEKKQALHDMIAGTIVVER